MGAVDANEAKTHLPKLLERVAKGERITIAKHGTPVTVLQPVEHARKPDPREVIARLRKLYLAGVVLMILSLPWRRRRVFAP